MGGGDLNAKKSWHPNTLKNQERVWKVEQADAAEKRKLAELQREITDERNREELKKLAHTSGVIDMGDDKKLEWMYRGPTESVNREEYLLGRAVDRTFEQLTEADNQMIGVTVPKNHVEHECIPFSIRAFRGAEGGEQVDMARKIMEDPLMAIKQKEMESRRKLLENPVKLKDFISKKEKKKKKKRRKSSSTSSESEGSDLDELLAKKYKKIQEVINTESGEGNLDLNQLLEDKYDKLTQELDKMGSKKSKKSSRKDDERDRSRKRSSSRERSRRRDERSPSRDRSRRRRDEGSSSQEDRTRRRGGAEKRRRTPSPVRTRRVLDDDEGSSRIVTKNYGLVSADGKSIKIDDRHRREERPRASASDSGTSKKAKTWTRPERQHLTEEEREVKRREMMENAVWRDKERERNVRRYREDDRKQRARDDSREFDKNFINKEIHKAVSKETVESRIKSNVNNIQRSSHSMNDHFARR
uniref:Putative pre-mrna-splicing factor cwc25 n=1 Tax=Lutzomyia longipalpis TaxID=7200 RepID=A0A1B0CUI4_LUTLO